MSKPFISYSPLSRTYAILAEGGGEDVTEYMRAELSYRIHDFLRFIEEKYRVELGARKRGRFEPVDLALGPRDPNFDEMLEAYFEGKL